MQFIHAGDVHLGNAFVGLDSRAFTPQLQTLLQRATVTAFEQLITDAITRQVDFVLFPGDLYNASTPSPYIENVVQTQFTRLAKAHIPVVMSFGNHDFAASQQTRLTWPENVTVFDQEVQTHVLTTRSGKRVAITGFSYQTQRQQTTLLSDFPQRDATADWHIGLYHGALGSDAYAPFTVSDLQAKRYDYWALGHIHLRQTLHETPFIGYSGSLQGLNRKERGDKGYYVVSPKQGVLEPEFIATAPVIWQDVPVTLVGETTDDVLTTLQQLPQDQAMLVTLQVDSTRADVALLQQLEAGILQQNVQQTLAQTHPLIGLVKWQLITPDERILPQDLTSEAWEQAMAEVFQEVNIPELLGNKLPAFVYDDLQNADMQAELQAAVALQLAQYRAKTEGKTSAD